MHERRFHALGTVAHVVADTEHHVDRVVAILEDLESHWSRFRPASDVSRLNGAAGSACRVHRDTIDLVERARAAWQATSGLYDPTVHDALVDAGYDRTFELIVEADAGDHEPTATRQPPSARRPCPGAGGIEIDADQSTIRLPLGVHLDLGGIGKGRAADVVVKELAAAGAHHVLVNLGGDLRARGGHPSGAPWRIGVEDPAAPERIVATLVLSDGAVATSTTARRHWIHAGQAQHHLIDPRTGQPATTSLLSVTVVAREAADADVLAKVALIADHDAAIEMLASRQVPALLVRAGGQWTATPGIEGYLDPAGVELTDERMVAP